MVNDYGRYNRILTYISCARMSKVPFGRGAEMGR